MLNDYAPSTFDSALSQSLTQREHFHLPLTQDLPEHLKFFFVVTLHDQHYVFSHHTVHISSTAKALTIIMGIVNVRVIQVK